MSKPQKAKRSIKVRLLALIGWIAIRTIKIAWAVLAFAGSRLARRKVDELNARLSKRPTSQPVDHSKQGIA